MNSRATLSLLLGVNAALAGAALWLTRPKVAVVVDSEGADPGLTTQSTTRVLGTSKSSSGTTAETAFSYRKILSVDLRRYVANLRAARCPEPTVQDIILAEVNRLFAPREAGLRAFRRPVNPWEPRPPGGDRDWAKYDQLRAVLEEKRALVKELLGIDLPADVPALVSEARVNRLLAALEQLPPEKRGPVRDVVERFWAAREALEDRVDGVLLPADEVAYRKVREDRVAGLKAILTPTELENFELATSSAADSLRSNLSLFAPSEDEFRRLFRAQADFDEQTDLPGQVVGRSGEQEKAANEATSRAAAELERTRQEFLASLTPERQRWYELSQNGSFQRTVAATDGAGLPRETALAIHDATQDLVQQMRESLRPSDGSRPNRDAMRAQMEQYDQLAQERVRAAIGDEAYQRLGDNFQIPGIPRPRSREVAPGQTEVRETRPNP
jgi:hypothetical protein